MLSQITFKTWDLDLAKMKDARGESGVRVAFCEYLKKVLGFAGAAEATIGTETISETVRVNSISKPFFVPSASIEVRSISPAPRSAATLCPIDRIVLSRYPSAV